MEFQEWSSRNVITIIKVWTEHFYCVCRYEEWGLITKLNLLCCSKNISHVDSHTHTWTSHLWNTHSNPNPASHLRNTHSNPNPASHLPNTCSCYIIECVCVCVFWTCGIIASWMVTRTLLHGNHSSASSLHQPATHLWSVCLSTLLIINC